MAIQVGSLAPKDLKSFDFPVFWLGSYMLKVILETRHVHKLDIFVLFANNSYMNYIIRTPILWLGISAYGGGVLSVYFSIDDVHRTNFFRNVNKMAAWIPDNKKKIKETMFIVNNRQLLLDMK
jgi:hypothetical protein